MRGLSEELLALDVPRDRKMLRAILATVDPGVGELTNISGASLNFEKPTLKLIVVPFPYAAVSFN